MRGPYCLSPPGAAGIAGGPKPVTVIVTAGQSDVGDNRISKLSIAQVFHTTLILRQDCVTFSIVESIRVKLILVGRTTALLPLSNNAICNVGEKNRLSHERLTRIYSVHMMSNFGSPYLIPYYHQLCTNGLSMGKIEESL